MFYKMVLVPIEENNVLAEVYPPRIASQLTMEERLPNCECEDCKGKDWVIYPKEMNYSRGEKPYIECLKCGYITHL